MKKTLLFLVAGFFFLNNLPAQKPIEQKEIRLVQYMPNIPFPYKMKNWKDIATKQDRLFTISTPKDRTCLLSGGTIRK